MPKKHELAQNISIDTADGVEITIDGSTIPFFFTHAEPVLHDLGGTDGIVPAVRLTIPAASIVTTSKHTTGAE